MAVLIFDGNHNDDTRDFHAMYRYGGIRGVLLKVSQHTSFKDPTYVARRERVEGVDMLTGGYHFASAADAAAQAAFFLDTMQPEPGDKIVLDWEENEKQGTMTLAGAEHFVEHIHDTAGRWPLLYASESFLYEHQPRTLDSPLFRCDLWVAKYGVQPPHVPQGYRPARLWQFSEKAHVPGVGNPCDLSRFNGDEDELKVWWAA